MDNGNETRSSLFRLSLRLRLTLWVITIFALIHVVLGTVFLLYQRSSIDQHFNNRLLGRAQAVQQRLILPAEDVSDGALARYERDQTRDTVRFEEFLIALYRPDGDILASSQRPAIIPEKLSLERVATSGAPAFDRFSVRAFEDDTPSEATARLVLVPFATSDGQLCVLMVAATDEFADEMLGLLTRIVVLSLPIGLIAAGSAGWIIAGLAVAPIEQVQRLATQLTPQSIEEELELEGDAEVVRLGQELDEARQRIADGFRAQERFMSNVSHELKTPIAVLLTESQTLDLTGAPEDVREFVDSAREEMRRLGRLVDSFLLLTRVRDGRREVLRDRSMVNEVVMDAIEHCATMASQHRVRLDPTLIDGEDDVDVCVAGDADLLRTMLDNLVRNAIRFSPAGERVCVTVRRDGNTIDIQVRDFGTGIPPEVIDRVFDRFEQAKSEVKRGRGHGLGLEIAQGIAELHDGRISVRNCDDGGCVFCVRLPAA